MNSEIRAVSMGDFGPRPINLEPEKPPPEEELGEEVEGNDWDPPQQPLMYHHPVPPPMMHHMPQQSVGFDLDKTVYIILFIAFILGFFMGKTMQPIIVRST